MCKVIKLVVVLLLCIRLKSQELEAEVRPNLVLWLDASRGVEVSQASKTVTKWTDQSGGGYSFAPLSAAQHRAAAERWLGAVKRQVNGNTINGNFQFVGGPKKMKKVIQFPAPLVANNLQLRDGITAFFVLTPTWLQDGEQALGQRFFGHYPFGQFRFLDKRLAFKDEYGNHLHTQEIFQDETIIAAYRFDGDVAMAINGMPFQNSHKLSRLRGGFSSKTGRIKPPVFSNAGYVTLGGCPPHNSFIGTISEIMIFGVPLDDDTSRHVAEVLADKYKITLADRAVSRAFQRNALPLSHDPSYVPIYRANPSVPKIHHLIDNALIPSQHNDEGIQEDSQTEDKPKGRDRVSAYKRHKNKSAGSSSDTSNLAVQLQETKAKLEQLQNLVQQQSPSQTNSEKISAPQPITASPKSKNMCLGDDAFQKQSITKWTPPPTAKLEDIQKWTAAKENSDNAIRSFPRGGKELRDFVHKQVSALRLLRHNMFCTFATSPEDLPPASTT